MVEYVETPLVSIVILNYNGKRYLKDCLDSVLAQDYLNYEVILVDNGSTDGSVTFVRETYAVVRIVENGVNLGFAEGNNRGTLASRGDYVVLLNNDTVVDRRWLSELVEAVLPGRVGAAASLVFTRGVPDAYYERGGSLSLGGSNIMGIFNDRESVFYPTGCAVVFKKQIVGLPFDNDYFIYSEDVYLGFRLRFMGFNVKQASSSIVYHIGSATAASMTNIMTFHQEKNRILNFLLFFSPTLILKIIPYIFLGTLSTARLLLLGGKPRAVFGLLRAHFWLIMNARRILEKRRSLAVQKVVREQDVIKYMTCKVANEDRRFAWVVNHLSKGYCALMNIRAIEFVHERCDV
jgi:GT2 family glycosyltransferase